MRLEGITKDLKVVRLKAPIPRPTKITLMGFNYRAHAAEMLEKVPEHPLLFSAYPTAVNGPGAPIVIARGSEKPDYEGEFGVVIGKRGRYVSADKVWVNGDLRQDSNTELQVFKIWDVISYMSTFWTLEPGDVLSTGTPVGVGHSRKPPVYLKHGDRVRIEISGLGVLENPVAADGRSAEN